LKLKRLKLSRFAWITIVIVAIFAVSIVATGYYYYVVPHSTRLRILYTHSDQMVSEVVNNFADWYKERYGRSIEVTFTSTDPQLTYETVTNPHRKPEAEIWWGGPLSLFEEASDNLLLYNSTQKSEMNATCHSCPLMDLNQSTPRWYAASLYALGIMYDETNSLKPQTWADLLKEEYEGNIAMVDPTTSEFTQSFIMLVLQNQNWTEGWEYLVRLAAFIKDYDSVETTSVMKVASGYLPIAVVPDFYAYDRIQELEGVGIYSVNFTYLDATVLQPDPIAIIKRGKYIEEAKAFVNYILAEQAQNIIGKYRLPVHPDATVTPPRINPFATNFPGVSNYNKTFEEIGKKIIKDYYTAWITERHEQIKTALEEIREANMTRGTNPNATDYYNLAWKNFTYAGYYINRIEIDTIYNETNGWTLNTEIYTDKWWPVNSTKAYSNAIENAVLSKQAVGPNIPLIAYYPYEVSGHNPSENYTQFLADLDLIKDLGFKGIKMHNVWNYWNANILIQAVDAIADRGLKFVCQLYYYESSEFPENTTRTDEFIAFVSDVASKLRSKDSLLWYALHYPWNWTERETYVNKVNTNEYRKELQRIIDAISANDSVHPIYMVSESIEYYGGTPPYNLTDIAGFGYQPYSDTVDDIRKEEMILENYRYFKEKGLNVYIDEWGVQTGLFEYGRATNETSKAEMIIEFVNYTQNWKIVWCYFGLYDLPTVDWGIANTDNSLKLSGEAMKEALKTDV